MSRREERDRDRGDRPSRASASARTNEYFVPRDGIDREVITADICRYLGNDALVRPGNYENPQTRVVTQGYFITAYRNLTSAMITDLKADSERWEAERKQTARGQQQNVEYRSSQVHQSRQYYGPTEQASLSSGGYPVAVGAYAAPTTSAQAYDTAYQQSTTYPSQPAQGYANTASGYGQEPYYVAGSNLNVDPRTDRSGMTAAGVGAVPRAAAAYPAASNAYPPADNRQYYPSSAAPLSSAQQGYGTPADPFYGRAAPIAGPYDTSTPEYDRGYGAEPRAQVYQESPVYSQASVSTPGTATSGSSRRDRDRDDRDSRRHHSRR